MTTRHSSSDRPGDATPFILLVDDDPSVRSSLQRLLEGESYRVLTAASGKYALDHLDHATPFLIITDLFMALISGWTLIDYLAEKSPATPIFVITAHAEETLGDRRSLVQGFFQKPLDIPRLLTAIRTCAPVSAATAQPK